MTSATERRVVVAGAGNMGRKWIATIAGTPGARVVGILDVDLAAATAAARSIDSPGVQVRTDVADLADLIATTGADVVMDATIPAAHHPVTAIALRSGCAVIGEKPAAQTVAQALSLCAGAEAYERLVLVSQSRRYNPHVDALVAHGTVLGDLGILQTDFYRAPHFGGFREEMDHPLLLDMAIHPFDTARYVLGAEPVSVFCRSFNPSWSWYRGDAAAVATFEMDSGAQYTYNASWCSDGAETSWNGSWRLNGTHGTVLWDGESDPVPDVGPQVPPSGHAADHGAARSGIAGAWDAFLAALEAPRVAGPRGHIHENVLSLVMVEAAIASARAGLPLAIDDLLERARERALADETDPVVRERLACWGPVREHLLAAGRAGVAGVLG
ncbi:Gfo/Idh/MocA family oxidoreductase [Occultella glacieicola]|uniref:Gfo/Idh/MocA family oxidoreductase n=1 Tax=Occultella glacieicola TaxID=2518684 RepID=A0ABY2E259_9MICO|nr:Gfo/Idh/MocA family oxidoreductase [Occultella glacieicola]TDE90752.1 Gfo/Idh/MocA family oxidoreductase [Occultella glacieicola]